MSSPADTLYSYTMRSVDGEGENTELLAAYFKNIPHFLVGKKYFILPILLAG